jgi:DNA-binding NarL/FixJ family response regulator
MPVYYVYVKQKLMKKIKLLIVDDILIIRDGIKVMLNKCLEVEVVAEANTGLEAINYLNDNPNTIDVVLMDIRMPEMGGIEATRIICNNFKNVKVLAITMYNEETYINYMIEAGALGYVLKESTKEELIDAIKTVQNGKEYYSNHVSTVIINSLLNQINFIDAKALTA